MGMLKNDALSAPRRIDEKGGNKLRLAGTGRTGDDGQVMREGPHDRFPLFGIERDGFE